MERGLRTRFEATRPEAAFHFKTKRDWLSLATCPPHATRETSYDRRLDLCQLFFHCRIFLFFLSSAEVFRLLRCGDDEDATSAGFLCLSPLLLLLGSQFEFFHFKPCVSSHKL